MQINHYTEDGKETILGLLSGEDIFKCQKSAEGWKIVMSITEPFDLPLAAEIINCKVSVLAAIAKMEAAKNEPKPPTNSSVA